MSWLGGWGSLDGRRSHTGVFLMPNSQSANHRAHSRGTSSLLDEGSVYSHMADKRAIGQCRGNRPSHTARTGEALQIKDIERKEDTKGRVGSLQRGSSLLSEN